MSFDTDSGPIEVDNRCTGCISHRMEDFEGPMVDTGQQIKCFGSTRTVNVQIGKSSVSGTTTRGKITSSRFRNHSILWKEVFDS